MPVINKIIEIFAKIKDGVGNVITSTDLGNGKRGLDISGTISATVDKARIRDGSDENKLLAVDANGNIGAKNIVSGAEVDPRQIRALTSSDIVSADQNGTWDINNISGTVSLPTGAATSAKQDTIITGLTTIDTDIKTSQPRKLQDGVGNAITSSDLGSGKRALDVSASLSGNNKVIIRDGANDSLVAGVDSSGNLKVVMVTTTPSGRTAISRQARGSVSGSSSTLTTYVIPSGQVLTIQFFEGGSQGATYDSRVALYYAPSGTLSGTEVIIANGYCAASNYQKALNNTYTGDGTAAIIIQRTRLDGTAKEIYAKWEGYY